MKKVRTRYAPSPTGYLHIGGARTALFNYLFAHHFNGDFIFRLEDTDINRNVVGGEDSQLDNLAWLGIIPSESPRNPNPKYGPYRQSEKLQRYHNIINDLIKNNKAYIAYDSKEELEAQKKEQEEKGIASFRYDPKWLKISEEEKTKRFYNKEYSIRMKVPKNEIYEWEDLVRGKISVNTNDIGDWVICKSDGYPTYNFCVVIDDHDMEISHILRGEEHISNTPKQIGVYKALEWEMPQFGHLTIITNMEGKKLSKRDTTLSQFIEDYKNEGYIPQSIFNFLSLLGWTSGTNEEIFTKEKLIEIFDYKRLSKSPTKFDIQKMHWFGKIYLKQTENSFLKQQIVFPNNASEEWKELYLNLYKESCWNIEQLKENLLPFLEDLPPIDEDLKNSSTVLTFIKYLKNVPFSVEGIQQAIEETKKELNINGKNLFHPIRLATTNKEKGPELAKAIFLYGKDKMYKRLKIY